MAAWFRSGIMASAMEHEGDDAVTQDYLAESGFCGSSPGFCLAGERGSCDGRASGVSKALGDAVRHADDCRVPILSLVVWILKREVRAIGGCLGIHRR